MQKFTNHAFLNCCGKTLRFNSLWVNNKPFWSFPHWDSLLTSFPKLVQRTINSILGKMLKPYHGALFKIFKLSLYLTSLFFVKFDKILHYNKEKLVEFSVFLRTENLNNANAKPFSLTHTFQTFCLLYVYISKETHSFCWISLLPSDCSYGGV